MKPKMFIGSSSEGLDLAYAIQSNLQLAAEVTVWDQGAMKPSATVHESLAGYLESSDFALFVFSPDDEVTIRGEESLAARDNVIFELGLFSGRLGKERCFILTPADSNLRIPTDLLGITCLISESDRTDRNWKAATGPASQQIRETISRLGQRTDTASPPTAGSETKTTDQSSTNEQLVAQGVDAESSPSTEGSKHNWLYAYIDKDYQRSLKLLEERIADEADPEERVDLEAWMGRIKYDVSRQEGETFLEKLIVDKGTFSSPYLHLATIRRLDQRYVDALLILDQGLESAQNGRPSLLSNKAALLIEIGRGEAAEVALRTGLAEFPDHAEFYGQLADYFQVMGKDADAIEILERGIKAATNREPLLARLASLYERSEKELVACNG